jgi:hypothetical protein
LLKRDRIKDFFRFPVSGLFDGSMKLWFLRRRSVRWLSPDAATTVQSRHAQ